MNMKMQQTLFRLTCAALIVAFGMLMPACGGGGSDSGGGVTNPLVARFTPDDQNPGAQTIAMAGSSAGSNVAVEVQVTDLDNFGGAGIPGHLRSGHRQLHGLRCVGLDPRDPGSEHGLRRG